MCFYRRDGKGHPGALRRHREVSLRGSYSLFCALTDWPPPSIFQPTPKNSALPPLVIRLTEYT